MPASLYMVSEKILKRDIDKFYTSENKLYEGFCGSRGSCAECGKLPQVMSRESASVGAEENEINLWVWR